MGPTVWNLSYDHTSCLTNQRRHLASPWKQTLQNLHIILKGNSYFISGQFFTTPHQPLKTRFHVKESWERIVHWLVQPKPTQHHHWKVKLLNQMHFSTWISPKMKAFALLFHLSPSVSGWYFKHLKITNKNRSKYYICNPKTFYIFILSIHV